MGESHGTCEETGKQHGGIPRYIGNGMYEKCGSELERPYPSPKGKKKAYKLGEINISDGRSQEKEHSTNNDCARKRSLWKVPCFIHVCREGKSERMSCRLTPRKKVRQLQNKLYLTAKK